MTLSQRLSIKASEQRSRLAELAELAELTDEQRAELGTLGATHQDTESQLRAAIAADDAAAPPDNPRDRCGSPRTAGTAGQDGYRRLSPGGGRRCGGHWRGGRVCGRVRRADRGSLTDGDFCDAQRPQSRRGPSRRGQP